MITSRMDVDDIVALLTNERNNPTSYKLVRRFEIPELHRVQLQPMSVVLIFGLWFHQ